MQLTMGEAGNREKGRGYFASRIWDGVYVDGPLP